MTTKQYLAFDLGASSGRAVLGTLEGGAMALEVVHRFETPIIEDGDHLFWDAGALWSELQDGLQKAISRAPDLRSLSVDSWAVDYVPLNEEGWPMRNPFCYRDPRTNGLMERAFETMPPAEIYRHTGIQFLPFNTLFQLLAEIETSAWRFLTIADYFNYRFSGRAVIDTSMASTTQMMDVRTGDWSRPIMEAFGIDAEKWPPIVPPGTRLGPCHEAPDVQVVASCSHDTASAVAAAPATSESGRWAFISCGTWSLLGAERTSPILSHEARQAGFTNEAGLDGTIRFLTNLTGLWALQECAREWTETDWAALENEARAASPVRAFIDLDDPRFVARGNMQQRLHEYCREHDIPIPERRGGLVRMILASVAESYRRALDDLESVAGEAYETLHLFGGGSMNSLLCELTAEACGKRVAAGPVEATALGNLLVQARTMGDLPDGNTVREAAVRSTDVKVYAPAS